MSDIEILQKAPPSYEPLSFRYKNYRGELSNRRAIPAENPVWFGSTEWHPELTWLLKAFDIEKQEWRDFKLTDCDFLSDGLVKSILEREAETTRRYDERLDTVETELDDVKAMLEEVLQACMDTPEDGKSADWYPTIDADLVTRMVKLLRRPEIEVPQKAPDCNAPDALQAQPRVTWDHCEDEWFVTMGADRRGPFSSSKEAYAVVAALTEQKS